jgi:hypothetical protein
MPETVTATILTSASFNTTTPKETIIIDVALPKEAKRIDVKVNIVGILLSKSLFTFAKMPEYATATLFTFASLNTTTTKETIIIDVALPKEAKGKNIKVNVVGISNVLTSVYICKNAYNCCSGVTYLGHRFG